MRNYNKSEIMSRAWEIYREFPQLSFSQSLTRSWAIAKKPDVTASMMNKILNNLRTFNRLLNVSENKALMAGTQEHFKLLNSKSVKANMKLDPNGESTQMIKDGILFMNDVMNQRRRESMCFTQPKKKIKTRFRNRIVDKNTCVSINIEEYINDNN